MCHSFFGITSGRDRGEIALTVGISNNFDSRNERQSLWREVAVLSLMRVGIVDSDSGNVDQDLICRGHWICDLTILHDIWPAELVNLNSSHCATICRLERKWAKSGEKRAL